MNLEYKLNLYSKFGLSLLFIKSLIDIFIGISLILY
jgi:hypothetical protein